MPVEKPEEKDILEKILDAASEAGAGNVGAYGRVAAVLDGYGTWRSEEGAHPYNGVIGEVTVAKSVRVEMQCPEDKVADVIKAVRALHPYEEPVIELVKLEDLPA
jgi:hypothetical protein